MYWPKFATFVKHKKDLLEDYVDCLSTWIASSLMLFFCSIASIGFYNGSHMECIIPAEYPGNFFYCLNLVFNNFLLISDEWRSFFKTYCFVQPHIFVHDSPDDQLLRSEIAYFPVSLLHPDNLMFVWKLNFSGFHSFFFSMLVPFIYPNFSGKVFHSLVVSL